MLFGDREAEYAQAFARYVYLNPFEQREAEPLRQRLLGMDVGLDAESAARPPVFAPTRPDVVRLVLKTESLLARIQERLNRGETLEGSRELFWIENLITGCLFPRFFEDRNVLEQAGDGTGRVSAYAEFAKTASEWLDMPLPFSSFFQDPQHMFAVFYQLRRSFELILRLVRGNSNPVHRLRAEIWHSIFPHELRLYGILLFDRMHDVTTLILGPSGTGKELVASAIGLSRYIAFDGKRQRFVEPLAGAFHAINLSAMSVDLIESEMFGHCAGAFTGATGERLGWFEKCSRGHAVFLDEIGELAESIQVKLLRVLQNREFFRVGETEPRQFQGKVIAATNRELDVEMAEGRFRQDLFYRLCSDVVRTPSLREQLDDCPDDLQELVRLIAMKCLGKRAEIEQIDWLTDLSVRYILASPRLGPAYPWPGNFRELEQCVRNLMVRGEYQPPVLRLRETRARPLANETSASPNSTLDAFIARLRAGQLSFDEVLEHYCSFVYAQSEHLTDAAQRLGKHRSTIQSRVVPQLVDAYRQDQQAGLGGRPPGPPLHE
jgi:DNA-binding NtrC family response regulator